MSASGLADWAGPESEERRSRAGLRPRALLRSVARNWVVASVALGASLGATLALLRVLPKTYHVQTQILARRQQVLPTLARPSLGDESPTTGAFLVIRRRDNLAIVVREAGLVEAAPAPSDSPESESLRANQDQLESQIKRVDAALQLIPGDGVLTIAIDWPNPAVAFRIVEATVRNYLEARRVAEISPIEEAIATLEARASQLRVNLDALEADAQKRHSGKGKALSFLPPPRPSGALQMEASIRAKREAIREGEDYRRRRINELRAQLTQEQALYGSDYPSLISLKQGLEALSHPSPQIAAQREELGKAEAAYARLYGALPDDVAAAKGPDSASREPFIDPAEARLKQSLLEYQAMMERIGSARIELETARSAFKYRYSVLWPAELPRAPDRPKKAKILLLGIVVGLLLAAGAALGADALAGRALDRDQIERKLGLPVLAEIGPPR